MAASRRPWPSGSRLSPPVVGRRRQVAARGRLSPPVAAGRRQVAARGHQSPLVAASGRPWPPVGARGRPWPPLRPWPLVAGRGRPSLPVAARSRKSQNTMKFASDVTGMPFGRTDVFIAANDAQSSELSHGHGFKGDCFRRVFESWDVYILSIKKKTPINLQVA